MVFAQDPQVIDLLTDMFNDIQLVVDELKERPDYNPEFVREEIRKALEDVDLDPVVFEGCDEAEAVLLRSPDPGSRAAIRKGCP